MLKNKPDDWDKWMVIYGNKDAPEYLSDAQHTGFLAAIEDKKSVVILKDGRVLPTYGRVTPNPEWHDPVEIERLRKAIQKREEYLKTKRDKELFDD